MQICRNNDRVMGSDSNQYASLIPPQLKKHILLALQILELKITLSLPITDHAQPNLS